MDQQDAARKLAERRAQGDFSADLIDLGSGAGAPTSSEAQTSQTEVRVCVKG